MYRLGRVLSLRPAISVRAALGTDLRLAALAYPDASKVAGISVASTS
jgi:hypothetical protein